jgi:DNA-binding NtrC family response regulator
MNKTILIIDDEKRAREGLAKILEKNNYSILLAKDGEEGIKLVKEKNVDLVLTDIVMPKVDGMEVLRITKEVRPETSVILVTAFGTIEKAVESMKQGADDFILKPINIEQLKIIIQKALQKSDLILENAYLKEQLQEKFDPGNIIGSSQKMRAIFRFIKQVAPTRATVLITGESGTGKELIAKAIHYSSPRKNKPFIKLSCSSLSEGVLESELFGHEKGSFTGAISQHKGRFEIADDGTLFLDEIGDISPRIQVKLLRFLQEREFERVGGTETIKVDVRLLAATNVNLKEAVEQKKFREDLYFRLNVVSIEIPPLRERKEDISLLIDYFIKKYSRENGKYVHGISNKALMLLKKYDWKGNVRELENCIENAVVMATTSEILPRNLPSHIANQSDEFDEISVKVGTPLYEVEKKIILRTLEKVNGNKTKAAELLGIGVRTVHSKLKEYKV